jgi:hypothetical protein
MKMTRHCGTPVGNRRSQTHCAQVHGSHASLCALWSHQLHWMQRYCLQEVLR